MGHRLLVPATDWTRESFVTAPRLVRADVTSYTGLDVAEKRKLLVPIGRRGGTGVRVYRTADVIAWLTGTSPVSPAPTKPVPPVRRAPAAGDALARIARAAGGAK